MGSESVLFRNGFRYRRAEASGLPSALRVEGLQYTYPGLLLTVLLIGIGAFGYFLMSSLVGAFLPVELEKMGASNTFIGIFITSIPYVLNMIITPVVSFQSDRLRTRLGRRMPYILCSAPFVTLFLILIGWTPAFCAGAEWMPQWLPRILLGMLSVGYQIFFLIVGSIIYYLFPDVIPERFIGRFMALFSLTGSLAGFIFSRWLLPFGENHLGWLFTAVSLFYLAVIVLMGRTVREGAYPPPDDAGKPFSPVGMVRSYFRDCYSIPFYYSFFIMMALSDVSTVCRAMFNFLYAKNTLGLSYAEFGEIMGWGGVVGVLLSFPVGLLVDRFHALRVYAFGLLLVVAVNLFSFFLVHDYRSFLVSSLLLAVVYTIQGAATLPCFVAILPKAYYGQFSSANALLRAAFMAICGAGGGALFDWLHNYQYIYMWDFLFTAAALGAFGVLYRSWQLRGGAQSYIAPLPRDRSP